MTTANGSGPTPPAGADEPEKIAEVLTATGRELRTTRPPDHAAENRALMGLAEVVAGAPQTILQKLAETACELYRAGSAGISVRERGRPHPEEQFRWHAVAGILAAQPRSDFRGTASPCAVVVERDEVLLFREPQQMFPQLQCDPPIVEALLAPFRMEDRERVGTIWVAMHSAERRFDAEDVRLLTNLSQFAASAMRAAAAANEAQLVAESLREREARLAFMVDLNTAIQALTDPDEVLQVIARMLGEHLHTDWCVYAEIEPDGEHFQVLGGSANGVPPIEGRHSTSQFGEEALEVLRSDHPYIIHDVENDPRAADYRDAYRQMQIQASIVFPLNKQGRFVAAMGVQQATARTWSQAEIELVGLVVARCWESLERARVARALRESETRFRLLADEMSQLAWIADAHGSLEWYNQRWFDFTGTTLEEVKGDGWRRVQHPAHVERVATKFKHCIACGEFWEDTFPLRGADGEYRWFLSRARPVREEDGRIVRWFGTNTDVTELRGLQEALRNADRRKDEFLAILAHELRNPLAPIQNAVHLLKNTGNEPDTHRECLNQIERQVRQMGRLIEDLLDVSRVATGKLVLRRERVTLASILESAMEMSHPLIAAAGHGLTIECPAEPMLIDGDPSRLSQVLVNLLNNAAKYSERGGRITLSASRAGDEAVIRVIDNGIGIPAEVLPQVFDLFTQVDGSLTKSQGGLGIGLTLVKRLVEMHGGRVEAQSAGVGQGSEFVVRLPVYHPENTGPIIEPPRGAKSGPRRRILVVDDNRDSAQMLALMLRRLMGHDVQLAYDGPEAVRLAEMFRPEVVLLDIGLPGFDGYEAARRIRAMPALQGVCLVALSGWGQDEDRQRSQAAGFDDHLVKPAEVSRLQQILDDLGRCRLDRR